MLAIIDARSPKCAIDNLKMYVDDIYLFSSENITYNSISGHPDIFIFKDENNLIIAPNSPKSIFDVLKKHNIKFEIGENYVGKDFNNSVGYNCISTNKYILHKNGLTENLILKKNSNKKFINLPQAYTRCSMINLNDETFLTSDCGITKVLDEKKLKNFYFSPEDIKIIGHKNGFMGGTCGIYDNKIFFNGNIYKHKSGSKLDIFLRKLDFEIISLHNCFLYDGGGIFFLENQS